MNGQSGNWDEEGGAITIPVESIMRASFRRAEEFAEKWQRNLGWRLLRQLRECGALAGTEDEFLRRIISRYVRDRTILDHQVGAGKIYTDAVLRKHRRNMAENSFGEIRRTSESRSS